MRLFLRCWEFIIEPQPHTLAHYYLLDRARKGMLYICVAAVYILCILSEYKLTLWSVCTLVDPEVKHIIYCLGWHSLAQIDKRISVHNKLFTLSIDRILSPIQNRHVCSFKSSDFKYFTYDWPRNGLSQNLPIINKIICFSSNLFSSYLFSIRCLIIAISRHSSLNSMTT